MAESRPCADAPHPDVREIRGVTTMFTMKLALVASLATVLACEAIAQTPTPGAPQPGAGVTQLACPSGTEVLVLIQQADAPVSVVADEIPAAGQGAAKRLNVTTVAANEVPATVDLSPYVHDLDVLVSVRPASGNDPNQSPSNLDGYIGCGQWQGRLAAGMSNIFLLQRTRSQEPPVAMQPRPEPKSAARPEPKPAPRQIRPGPDDLGRLIDRAAAEKSTCKGLAVGVRAPGLSASRFFGTTGNRGVPTADTEFELGGLTTTFTSAVLAWADQQGKMHLNDPLEKFAPSHMPSWQGQPILLRHLAEHTSGLPFQMSFAPRTADDMWQFLKHYRLAQAPGAEFVYSNFGANVLGLALTRAHRASLDQLYARAITGPLRMPDTAIELSPALRAALAWGYGTDGQRAKEAPGLFPGHGAAWALHSTLHDMMRYLEFELGEANSPLDPLLPVVQQQRHAADQGRSVGLGWYIRVGSDGAPLIYGIGGTYGFSSIMMFSPSGHTGVVALANQARCGAEQTGAAVFRGLTGTDVQAKGTSRGEDF